MHRKQYERKIVFGALFLGSILVLAILGNLHASYAYAPQGGDNFHYSETTAVSNGQGSYSGYTEQFQTTGMEQMKAVHGDLVSASYSYSYQYSNNQGSATSSSDSGDFSWSASTFAYVNGTDNQVGFGGIPYSKPLYVWFAMKPSLAVGSSFTVLNTKFTVLSANYTLQLPTENKNVRTIQAEGSGQYQRNDVYGVFNASYTWDEFFDPATGYIVAYHYVEQDNGEYQGQAGSFTYTDDLYVSSTSYPLTVVSTPPVSTTISPIITFSTNQGISFDMFPYVSYLLIAIVLIFLIAVAAYAATRRKGKSKLPQHPYPPYSPPPAPPPSGYPSQLDLGARPPEQVVIRDVAKVNCKYCGTLIPTTAGTCPYCGAPRQ